MKKMGFIKDAIILCVITLVSGLLLGFVYDITKIPIEKTMENTKQKAYKSVMSEAANFEQSEEASKKVKEVEADSPNWGFGKIVIQEVVEAKDGSGTSMGYVVTSSSNDGFNGEVKISVGVSNEGEVKGIAYLLLAETPGLGMKAKDEEFYTQYADRMVENFEITKTGANADNQINAISGATITSNAVNSAVNAAVYFVNNYILGDATPVALGSDVSAYNISPEVR